MHHSNHLGRHWRLLVIPAIGLLATACAGAGLSSPAASSTPTGSAAAEASGSTIGGDVPDNAVFETYHGTNPSFSIKYVQGWQVKSQPDGVAIRDKDSSETVVIVAAQADVGGYVTSTDLPALKAEAGFKLVTQDTVKVGTSTYQHLLFHVTSPPDAVTGKQVPLVVDRYFVPGPAGLAIVSLATPDGVDNVDAFLLMIKSFAWS